MRKRKFTEEQKLELQKNPNVKKVTSVGVLYKDIFKKEAIGLYEKGISAIDIFIQAGFNIEIIGRENPSKILSKWRCGIGYNPNEIKTKENIKHKVKLNTDKCTYSDKDIKRIIARNKYLEAENDFLKKLRALEDNFR